MVSIREKTIKGKNYLYAEHSFRLLDGSIKKISKKINNKEDANSKEVNKYFLEQEIKKNQEIALKNYVQDRIFTKNKILELEVIRVKYKHLINSLTKKQLEDIIDRFTVNHTYETNALEGNSLTLKDVIMILSENITPDNKDLREVFETKNSREAHNLLFSRRLEISMKIILELQKIIVKDTGVTIGFKKFPNYLLMRQVKTASPEKVIKELEKLIAWYFEKKKTWHPLKLAAHFHALFEKIHPFEDGNGCVGRLLINIILIFNNFPPLIIRKTMRKSYFNSLEAFDNGYEDKIERFILEKFENTFKNFFAEYVKYV